LGIVKCLVTELIIHFGADVNQAMYDGGTPVILAAYHEHLEVLSFLSGGLGGDIDKIDGQGNTDLLVAASKGRLAVVRVLLKHGADANLATQVGTTPLMAAAFHNHAEVVIWLVKAGAAPQIVAGVEDATGTAMTAAFVSTRIGASAEQTA
jgi:ankyrin repeat protein